MFPSIGIRRGPKHERLKYYSESQNIHTKKNHSSLSLVYVLLKKKITMLVHNKILALMEGLPDCHLERA